MSLCEVEALFFVPVVLALYWLLPARAALQNLWLLLASYVFYVSWDPRCGLLLLAATLVDWAVGLGLAAGRSRRWLLALSLATNLGALIWFKYSGLLTGHSLALPLGLSYFTLQKIGYVVDVYHGRREPCRSLLTFATFVAFFPQLTAGPISRGSELLPQFATPRRLDAELVAVGCGTWFLGFVLKAFAADVVGPALVNPVFQAPASYGGLSCWLAAAMYAVQVFCDFGGASLIAIGVAKLFGIDLPRNFDFPFLSRNLPEFWRRWHISLNRWLFDYIFTPLTTSQGLFRGRLGVSVVLVFLVSGAWHGPSLTFLVWGLLHGLGMAVWFAYDARYRQRCRQDRQWVARRRSTGYGLGALLLTQAFFVLTMVPFRAGSMGGMSILFGNLFGFGHGELSILPALRSSRVLVALAVPVVYHLLATAKGQPLRDALLRAPAPLRGIAYGLAIVYLLIYVPVGASTFLYQNF